MGCGIRYCMIQTVLTTRPLLPISPLNLKNLVYYAAMESDTAENAEAAARAKERAVLVGTYRKGQLRQWRGWYNYPISGEDKITGAAAAGVDELWLFCGTRGERRYEAQFAGFRLAMQAVGGKCVFTSEFNPAAQKTYQANFGVPQHRERIYMVAFRNDYASDGFEFQFPEPTGCNKTLNDIRQHDVSAKYYLSETYVETLRRRSGKNGAYVAT